MVGTVICKETTVWKCISVVSLYVCAIETSQPAQTESLLTFCAPNRDPDMQSF